VLARAFAEPPIYTEKAMLKMKYKGVPEKLEIEPCERALTQDPNDFFTRSGSDSYVLRFPKIVDIEATTDGEELRTQVDAIRKTCSLVYENIARKRNGRFIFKEYKDGGYFVIAFTGPTSVQLYRNNLVESLAEAFINLKWIYETNPDQFNEQEFRAYEGFFRQLEGLESYYEPLPVYVKLYFQELKKLVDGC